MNDALAFDDIQTLAESIPQPTVTRILVTRVVRGEALQILDRRWLLVSREMWTEVEAADETVTRAYTDPFSIPVERVPPDSDREREILDELLKRAASSAGGEGVGSGGGVDE